MTAALRTSVGSAISRTYANSVANNAYSNSADAIRIKPGVSGAGELGALLADFRITSVTFSAAPTTGVIQLVAVDRDLSANAGPTPASTMRPRLIGTFSPQPQTSNASTGWIMSLNSVALSPDADYYLYNNGTGVNLTAAVLTAQCWSPGV